MSVDFGGGAIYGLIYGVAAIGLSLPLRYLKCADLSTLGSMTVGGVIGVAAANGVHGASPTLVTLLALAAGALGGAALGATTAVIAIGLSIPIMLAGVITLTASESIGLMFAVGGTIDLTDEGILASNFAWSDIAILVTVASIVVALNGAWVMTKWGTSVAFLSGSERFVQFRHRSRRLATTAVLMTGNGVVGLAGALMALKTKQGHAQLAGLGFISFGFGAIFAGEAAVRLVARALKKQTGTNVCMPEKDHDPSRETFASRLRTSFSDERSDASRVWFVLTTYVLAAILLNTVALTVRGQMLSRVPPMFENAAIAGIILAGLALSRFRKGEEP